MNIYTRPLLFFTTAGLCLLVAATAIQAIADSHDTTVIVVETDPSKRSVATHLNDKKTTIKIRNRYFDNVAEEQMSKHHINVTTVNGVVLLVGEVPDAESKDRLALIAQSEEHARQVIDELRVMKPLGVFRMGKDTFLESAVKFRVGKAENLPVTDVTVISSDKVVYLMGLVTAEEAKEVAKVANETSGVERVVSIFEIIEEN